MQIFTVKIDKLNIKIQNNFLKIKFPLHLILVIYLLSFFSLNCYNDLSITKFFNHFISSIKKARQFAPDRIRFREDFALFFKTSVFFPSKKNFFFHSLFFLLK